MSKSKEIAVVDQDQLAVLRQNYPVEPGFTRALLPRISMVSQDKTEVTGKGKDKKVKVTDAAGTFYIERQTDETDEFGKKIWSKEELGESFNGIIVYRRKQLRYYDEGTQMYTSSPIYDEDTEIVPLFCDKKEVARGTPATLKAGYQFTDTNGKVKSKLEENRILYVLYGDELFQLNLRGSSMWSFLAYARKVLPPSVVTTFSSEAMEKGDIEWNKMTFQVLSSLAGDEIDEVLAKIADIKQTIAEEKAYFASQQPDAEMVKANDAFGRIGDGKK